MVKYIYYIYSHTYFVHKYLNDPISGEIEAIQFRNCTFNCILETLRRWLKRIAQLQEGEKIVINQMNIQIIYSSTSSYISGWLEKKLDGVLMTSWQLTQGEEIDTMPNMENYYSCLETFLSFFYIQIYFL